MFFAAKWEDVIFAVAVNPAVVAVSGIVALRLAGRCFGYHENAAQAVRAQGAAKVTARRHIASTMQGQMECLLFSRIRWNIRLC